ncbi:hypothetical protein IAI53_04685 [Thauera sp. CAU 1555]|uniref:Uncharacterized protein n=1 Tax=Thauera sedimentorum TaxID=2767595 RepID=A0ABR9B747_9RHOO|nr:hypothetical protein [Thauera sedimentorum]MBC9071251.1 hypothetical protein [Thauera sedimentorum]MBD8502170.1 hypothetical protein [Thauera sedimentorum]
MQPAETGRCPTCKRWGGVREHAGDGATVLPDPQRLRGPCVEGPWHGSLRGPRNACGQWVCWLQDGHAPAPDKDA